MFARRGWHSGRDRSPFFRLLGVIDLRPRVSRAKPVGLTVMVRHGMIILDSIAEKQVTAFLAGLPPWRNTTARRFAAEVREHFPGFVEDIFLLLRGLYVC